jgi:hypothetical protein
MKLSDLKKKVQTICPALTVGCAVVLNNNIDKHMINPIQTGCCNLIVQLCSEIIVSHRVKQFELPHDTPARELIHELISAYFL